MTTLDKVKSIDFKSKLAAVLAAIAAFFALVVSKIKAINLKKKSSSSTQNSGFRNDFANSSPTPRVPLEKRNLRPVFKNEEGEPKPRKKFSLAFFKTKKFQYFILPLLIISALAFYGYYTFAYGSTSYFSAKIKYKFIPIDQSKVLSFNPSDPASEIKVVKLQAEKSTTSSVNTTGEKATGGRAVGKISVYNLTADIKVIKSGTFLTCITAACKDLTYTTDHDLNLGPGSTDKVSVTAADIGQNYNVALGSGRFKVANYSPTTEILASNIEAVAGGTPKVMVKVVSAADIKNTTDSTIATLKEEALAAIKSDPLNANFVISDASFATEVTTNTSDFKENEEAEIVNITIGLKGTVDAFEKAKIDEVSNRIKTEFVPEGYALDEKQTSVTSSIQTQQKDKLEIKVTLKSIARIKLDMAKLKSELAGMSYSDVDAVLSKIPHTTGYSKDFSPKTLPEFFWKVPTAQNRIQIELIAEQ